jgi:hypothetical protein
MACPTHWFLQNVRRLPFLTMGGGMLVLASSRQVPWIILWARMKPLLIRLVIAKTNQNQAKVAWTMNVQPVSFGAYIPMDFTRQEQMALFPFSQISTRRSFIRFAQKPGLIWINIRFCLRGVWRGMGTHHFFGWVVDVWISIGFNFGVNLRFCPFFHGGYCHGQTRACGNIRS